MPLPWLIGAAVVALGAAAVSALNNDKNSGSGGNDGEEKRKRELAEQERKVHAHKQKLDSMNDKFVQDGIQRLSDLQKNLEGVIKITVLDDNPFKATLGDNETFYRPVSPTYVDIYDLQFLPHETQESLLELESLFDIDIEPEKELLTFQVKLNEVDHKLAQLKELREKLESLRDTTSGE